MGFNNDGLEIAIQQLKKNKGKLIIGGNIGKNTQTATALYTRDYELCFKGLHPYVDYFVLNVSCPNVGSESGDNDLPSNPVSIIWEVKVEKLFRNHMYKGIPNSAAACFL